MKRVKFFLIIGIVFLLAAPKALSQDNANGKDIRFTIKTNPLSAMGGPLFIAWIVPLTSEYKVYFEAKTTPKQSIQIGVGYLGSSPLVAAIGNLGNDTTVISSGYHVQLWYKFFMTGDKAPGGFYIAPHVSYAAARVKNNKEPDKYFDASKLTVTCDLGYQIITKGHFALDIFTGLGVKKKDYNVNGFELSDWKLLDKFTVSVPLGFSFGYAF
jgi:hypothetical protein